MEGGKEPWVLSSMVMRQRNHGHTTESILELTFKQSDTVVFEIGDAVSQLLDSCVLSIGRSVVPSIGMGATAWVAPLS